MNAGIETLNRWGESFLSFAWPMLWQSSLLIVVVFALDWMFARKIRASVRYALWMVVLVKLLLPPALALPTGATWWLWRPQPSVPTAPVVKNYTVSFDQTVLPDNYVPSAAPIILPSPKLSGAGLAVLAIGSIDMALLIWLAFRWFRIEAKVRRATANGDQSLVPRLDRSRPHPGPLPQERGNHRQMVGNDGRESQFQVSMCDAEIIGILPEVCRLAGLRGHPRLKLMDEPLSPAVYGLFRPVILLPRALAEKLSTNQLRAVLLHEAIHARRGDIWVNCAQALLQIFYWWHPLLWLANARIRRVREEAVDDAVMLALRADAESYAPTLLEVAKFAFRRPMASLGLVGILESRSALRQRIERLVDFRPPRRAGITFLSLCGIFVFGAVALPMGQGPEQIAKPTTVQKAERKLPWPDPNFEGDRFVNLRARFLILDDSQLAAAIPPLANASQPMVLSPDETKDYLARLAQNGARCFYKGWENGILQAPLSGGYQYYRIGSSTNQFADTTALTTNWEGRFSNMLYGWGIQTPTTQPDWTPMDLTLRALIQDGGTFCQMDLSFPNGGVQNQHSDITIPDGDGLVWVTSPPTAPRKRQIIIFSPLPSDKESAEPAPAVGKNAAPGEVIGNLDTTQNAEEMVQDSVSKQTESALNQALAEEHKEAHMDLVAQASTPVKGTNRLEMRTFKVDADTFCSNLFGISHSLQFGRGIVYTNSTSPRDINPLAIQFFEARGLNLNPPKSVYFNYQLGLLFVYATPQDLDAIQRAVQVLNEKPVLVHIKYRFFEVPKAFFAHSSQDYIPAGVTNGIGVMPNPDYQVFLHELEQKGTEVGINSGGSTLSGKQMEMRADDRKMVYNAALDAYEYEEQQDDPALVLDVIPHVMADGYTIDVQAAAYQEIYLSAASKISNIKNFSHVKASAYGSAVAEVPWAGSSMHRHLYDGQTMILYSSPNEKLRGMSDKELWNDKDEDKDKMHVVLVTATLIDSAGNRIHSDDEMPFAETGFPPQSP